MRCNNAFRLAKGLSQQRRRAHPTEYHAEDVLTARVKARWDHGELLIMARAEITLPVSGVRNINQRLAQITPDRTLKAIKEVRKSTRYHELLASLQPEAQSGEPIEREMVGPDQGSPAFPDDTIPDPSPNQWAVEVGAAIEQLGGPDDIDIDAINPGLANNHTRDMLDAEYARWLPPLAGPNRRPPRRTGAPRVRRAQCGRGVGLPTSERSDLSDYQGSAACTTSFPVLGRSNLPQYLYTHPCMTIVDIH